MLDANELDSEIPVLQAIWHTSQRAAFCDLILTEYYKTLKAWKQSHMKQHHRKRRDRSNGETNVNS
jgi:hypothetical protein